MVENRKSRRLVLGMIAIDFRELTSWGSPIGYVACIRSRLPRVRIRKTASSNPGGAPICKDAGKNKGLRNRTSSTCNKGGSRL